MKTKMKKEKINEVKKAIKEKEKAAKKILLLLKEKEFEIKDEYEIKIKCSHKYCNLCCPECNTYYAIIKIQHPTLDTITIKCKPNDDFSIMEILSIKFNDDREIIVNKYNECKDKDFISFKETKKVTIVEAKKLTELYEYLSE